MGPPGSVNNKPIPYQSSCPPVMTSLLPMLIQPAFAPPELLQHLMADVAGCRPHASPAIGTALIPPGVVGLNDGGPLYCEGPLMMEGSLARWVLGFASEEECYAVLQGFRGCCLVLEVCRLLKAFSVTYKTSLTHSTHLDLCLWFTEVRVDDHQL